MSALPSRHLLRTHLLCLLFACTAATGQAMPPGGGVEDLQQQTVGRVVGLQGAELRLPHPGLDTAAEVNALLQAPLSADAAVRIAVLNNPQLHMLLGAAGVSITDAVRASNPAKLHARQAITLLTNQAFKAWVGAVAAAQSAKLLQDAKETLESGGELTRRMTQVGNAGKLAQVRAQLALSDAAIALARAQMSAFSAREALIQILGLWGAQTQFLLPSSLPTLPDNAREIPNVEALALQARADLLQARDDWQRKQAGGTPSDPENLWDALGDAAKVQAPAIRVRSQAREAYFSYRTAFDIAHHLQSEVIPLRGYVLDEMVLRYNGMLSSIFEVIADSQARTLAANAALGAQRDFWLAEADLQALLAGAALERLTSIDPLLENP